MSTSISVPPSRDSGQSVSTLTNRMIKNRAGEKISTSDDIFQGTPGNNALAFKEIQKALSNISSNLGKFVPVERQHVVPPAIATFIHFVFLMLIRRPVEDFISAVLFIVLLTSFAWTALKPMHHRLDEIYMKIDVLQNSIELAVSRRPTIVYVPDVFPDPVKGTPPHPGMLEPTAQPIESRQAPRPIEQDEPFVNAERPEPEPFIISTTPEPERVDEPFGPIDPIPAPVEPTASDGLPVTAENPIQAAEPDVPVENPVIPDEQDLIPAPGEPSEQDGQNFDIPTVSVSPAPPGPAARVKEATSAPAVKPGRQSMPPFGQWTLSEIKQKIEPLASATQILPLEQREPVVLVSLRRITLRLLMYCASLSTADFASPNGFLGPSDSLSYYPTGDLEGDRSVAFNTALDCIDELMILLTGSKKSEIAGALSELAQALNDLGLHEYASSVSDFALEIFRDLYAAEPDLFYSRLVSVQSLRAHIFVDLRQNDDAAVAAEEAVTILKDHGNTQTSGTSFWKKYWFKKKKRNTQAELVYAMLNYAVLLGSIGRGEGAAAVAFELMGFFEDPTSTQPVLVLVSSLCKLCVSNALIESNINLALSEAEKAIEASRVTLARARDGNSKVVLAGALLTKSKILSSKGQTDDAYAISAEAVTLFRSASVDRHVYSLLLAHALDTHSHQLSEANRRVESFRVISEAVELWQALQISAPVATKRPLAWALFELAKYRHRDADKQKLRNELQIAESAVITFRDVEPLDYAGLAEALYLYADRMLELDRDREAATYAEESVQYFQEAEETPHKYALDLIFALSLASSCLAGTERSDSALEYAKVAIVVQHGRKGEGETQNHRNHLRKLLRDVVHRGVEMNRQDDILPWMRELEQLGEPEGVPLVRRGGKPQPKNDTEFRKETSYWMDGGNSDKGKGREARRLSRAEEEILSPAAAGAAAQRRRDALAGMGSPRGGSFGSRNNNDLLSGLGGMGGMDGLLGSGLGGLGGMGGGGFDPGMFGPGFFRGRNKDKADGDNKGTSGTGTRDSRDTQKRDVEPTGDSAQF